jgi:hypothetical protein
MHQIIKTLITWKNPEADSSVNKTFTLHFLIGITRPGSKGIISVPAISGTPL